MERCAGGRGVLVAGTTPPDVVELWDWSLGPGDRHASEAHAAGTKELVHVLEGAISVEVDDQVIALEAGDAVAFPATSTTSTPISARTLPGSRWRCSNPGWGRFGAVGGPLWLRRSLLDTFLEGARVDACGVRVAARLPRRAAGG